MANKSTTKRRAGTKNKFRQTGSHDNSAKYGDGEGSTGVPATKRQRFDA